MVIKFLNYSLKKLQEKNLEQLRNWRNNEVREFMIYQEYISIEMQQKWFESINNINNYYFIIYKENTPIGLIDIKNIDWEKETSESGIFIAQKEFRNTDISSIATVMSATFISKILKLKSIYGKVLAENKQAIAYNLATGFEIIRKNDTIVIMCIKNITTTFPHIVTLKEKLCKIHKQNKNQHIELLIDDISYQHDESVNWLTENKIKSNYKNFKLNEPLHLL